VGEMLMVGIIVAIPCVIIAGPVWTRVIRRFNPELFVVKKSLPAFGEVKEFDLDETPGFGLSVFTSLFPVVFMILATIYQMAVNGGTAPKNPHGLDAVITMLGNPVIAMVVALLFAIWSMGFHRGRSMKEISGTLEDAIKSIAMLLMVIAGGSAFKQVLIDGGVGKAVQQLMMNSTFSPILLAWLITVILRISLGSATVSGMTASGLIMPLMHSLGADPVMIALAIGAGSLAASHVNDAGFWMFSEYFDLSVKQTFQVWTTLETVISVVGLLMVLLMNMIIH